MSQSTNRLLKIVIALLLTIIVVVLSIFAASAYWASYQKQQIQNAIQSLIPKQTPTPTPSKYTIGMNTYMYNQRTPNELIGFSSDSPKDFTFSTDDILYNGKPASSYGSFAPVLESTIPRVIAPISQFTIVVASPGAAVNAACVYFPRGNGSPWASGVKVQMSITTSIAQGLTTFTLP